MIVRYPPLGTTPRTDDRFVLNVDFAPTFVSSARRRAAHARAERPERGAAPGGTPVTWRRDMLNEHWNGTFRTMRS
jgi:arylsulfatase A-like enzyme